MPEVTYSRTGEMLSKLMEILLQNPDGIQARDALAELENRLTLSDYEQGTYPSGGRRFEKIVRFATVDLVKAGWIHKEKGKWTITVAGAEAHKSFHDPETFYKEAVRLYNQWKSNQPENFDGVAQETEEENSVKSTNITLEKAEEQAWYEIDQYLRTMNPYEFQEVVASLLRAMGYHVSWIAPPGKDGGIDILAALDPLGTRAPRIKVQVKRQSEPVNVDGLRSFMALLSRGDVGIFVSVGGFTKDAADESRRQENRTVTLLNNEALFDLWIEYYEKLGDQARQRLPLRPIHFLALEA